MKKILAMALIAGMTMMLVLTGCNQKTPAKSSSGSQKTFTIAFVPGITTDEFYISMKKGVDSEAKKLGIKVIYQGASTWDYTKQAPIIEAMIAQKPDLIITAPTDTSAMIIPLKKASDAGIPIITVDTNISDTSFIVTNITSDNLQGGSLAADAIAKLANSTGEVALMNTIAGITTTDQRQIGFENEIKKYPNMKLVSEQYCNDEANTAAAKIQDIILGHPSLVGVFAANVVTADGVQTGINAKGDAAKVSIVAYDAGPSEVDGLKSGTIAALIVQKPMEEGSLAVDYANDYLTGKKDQIPTSVLLPAVVATKDNMTDPTISQWFYTK
jgi:ribose transport system substrate-binding protein